MGVGVGEEGVPCLAVGVGMGEEGVPCLAVLCDALVACFAAPTSFADHAAVPASASLGRCWPEEEEQRHYVHVTTSQ